MVGYGDEAKQYMSEKHCWGYLDVIKDLNERIDSEKGIGEEGGKKRKKKRSMYS